MKVVNVGKVVTITEQVITLEDDEKNQINLRITRKKDNFGSVQHRARVLSTYPEVLANKFDRKIKTKAPVASKEEYYDGSSYQTKPPENLDKTVDLPPARDLSQVS